MHFNKETVLNELINKYHYNDKRVVGCVSDIIHTKKWHNLYEYIDYYHTNYLTDSQLKEYCVKIYTEHGKELGLEIIEIYNYLCDLLFYRTYTGIIIKEKQAIQWLSINNVYNIIKSSDNKDILNADVNFAVDLFGIYNNFNYGFQIKPLSYKKDKMKRDHSINIQKNIDFLTIFPEYKGVIYIYYDKNIFSFGETITLDNREGE